MQSQRVNKRTSSVPLPERLLTCNETDIVSSANHEVTEDRKCAHARTPDLQIATGDEGSKAAMEF